MIGNQVKVHVESRWWKVPRRKQGNETSQFDKHHYLQTLMILFARHKVPDSA